MIDDQLHLMFLELFAKLSRYNSFFSIGFVFLLIYKSSLYIKDISLSYAKTLSRFCLLAIFRCSLIYIWSDLSICPLCLLNFVSCS